MTQRLFYALRRWRGRRATLAGLALSVGLGIGANAVVLTSARRLIWEPPVPSADHARMRRITILKRGPTGSIRRSGALSYPVFAAIQADSLVLQGAFGYQTRQIDVEAPAGLRRAQLAVVTDDYFSVLGVRPSLGQTSGPEWSATGVAVSHHFWQGALEARPEPLGTRVRVGDRVLTVTAVLPRNFDGLDLERVDLWVPLAGWSSASSGDWRSDESSAFLRVVGLSRPGSSTHQVEARLSALLDNREPPTGAPQGARPRVLAHRLARVEGSALERLDRITWVLVSVSALLLAAAGANVAGILLSRLLQSRRDIAVRLALGADSRHLLAVLMLDALPVVGLGLAAGLAGTVLARSYLRTTLLPTLAWSDSLASLSVFTTAGALAVVLLGGWAVFLWAQVRRTNLTPVLGSAAFGSTSADSPSRSALVGLQAGAATLLIVGSLLFVRTYSWLSGDRLGFDVAHVAVVDFEHLADSLPAPVARERLKDLARRLRMTPGVVDAGVATGIPLRQSAATSITFRDRRVAPLATGGPYVDAFDGNAMAALGTRLLRGRLFDTTDVRGSQPVVVVNATIVRTVWGVDDPIGSCLYFDVERLCRVVIGVVHDIQREDVLEGSTLQTFIPLDQAPEWLRPRAVFVRASSPSDLHTPLRSLAQASGFRHSQFRFDTYQDILAPDLVTWRTAGAVLGVYGLVALVVAASGVFATVAFSLAARRRELAIRRALGASFIAVLATVGVRLSRACTIGAGAACATAIIVWRYSDTLFYGTVPSDVAWTSAAALIAVGAIASAGVAWGTVSAWKADASSGLRES